MSNLPDPFKDDRLFSILGNPENYAELYRELGPKIYVFVNPARFVGNSSGPEGVHWEPMTMRKCETHPQKNIAGKWSWRIENISEYQPVAPVPIIA